ncbi:GNAT family N-acetyltransferase [Kineosporia babensis]|uniref:GNAT family N-acetyltransferase n=1 Tax=Kineosporia babensis TaxID=499548 RepID=A0A9X1NFI3_9ACTN|nr:GNAT family N-acetyltransferase [Kineosporia babensis]MCD5314047.1 GNAT family N-acetyltransferase [Kineosporia babensis]
MTQVREAVLADLPVLVELRTAMFTAMGVTEIDPDWRPTAQRWLAARIEHPDHCLYVVEDGGQVVSSALGSLSESKPSPARPFGYDLHISNISTLPGFRGRGHAGAAFEAVLNWGRSRPGPVRARLFATADGRGIYERAGFVTSTWPSLGRDLS